MKIKPTAVSVAIIALLFCMFSVAAGVESNDDNYAVLKNVKGTILIKSSGDMIWREARNGEELFYGDTIKTRSNSSGILYVDPGNFVKLLPLTTIQVAEFLTDDGFHSTIFNVSQGRILTKTDVPDDSEQVVVKVNKAFYRGSFSTAFVEAGTSAGCLDLIKGAAAAASADRPTEEIILSAGQRFSVDGSGTADLLTLADIVDESTPDDRTCLTTTAKKDEKKSQTSTNTTQATISEDPDGSIFVILTNTSSVNFGQQEEASASVSESTSSTNSSVSTESSSEVESASSIDSSTPSGGVTTYSEPTVSEEGGEEYVTFSVGTTVSFDSSETSSDSSSSTATASTGTGSESTSSSSSDDSELAPSISMSDFGQPDPETTSTLTQEYVDEEEVLEELIIPVPPFYFEVRDNEVPEPTGGETEVAIEPCTEFPEIFDVTVSDEDVDDTDEVIMESEFACDLEATATVRWSSSLECGAVGSMTIGEADKAAIGFDGAGVEQTATEMYEFRILDNKPHEMMIKSVGDNGKETYFTFTIKLQGQSLAALPQLSDVTVNGKTIEADDSIEIQSTDCETMTLQIRGTSYSECGDVRVVEAEIDGSELAVRGRDTWSTIATFEEEDSFTLSLKAEDVTGRESEPFNVDIDLVRAIDPPEISIETIGGEPVVMFGDPMELFRNDLVDGKLILVGTANSNHCAVSQVDISVDDSSSWNTAEGTTNFTYRFRPSDGDYYILGRSFDTTGQESEEMMNPIEMIYSTYTLEEKLLMTFEEMMQAYRDKDTDTFMEDSSPYYSSSNDSIEDYSRLELALNNKFSEQSSIYVRYQVISYIVSGDTGRVAFQWDANPGTTGYSHTATFVYTKTRSGWKFNAVEDNNTFLRHTDQVAYLSASSDKTSMIADRTDTATITVDVRDSAYDPVKDGTMVTFSATTGEIDTMAVTAEGQVDLQYTAGSTRGTTTITVSSGGFTETIQITMLPEAGPAPPYRER